MDVRGTLAMFQRGDVARSQPRRHAITHDTRIVPIDMVVDCRHSSGVETLNARSKPRIRLVQLSPRSSKMLRAPIIGVG